MIDLKKQGDIYSLTMNNNANTICPDWQQQMLKALDTMESDYGQGTALVMTGEEKFFCNGVNIEAVSALDKAGVEQFAKTMLEIHRRMLLLPFPTIAAINGHAFAGGAFLALSLDYRIMREDRGWIAFSEVDVGVPIPSPMMAILQAKLSPATVRDAVLTGKRYTAPEAIKAGLVDTQAPADSLADQAEALALTLAVKEPGIFKAIKQTLYGDLAVKFL